MMINADEIGEVSDGSDGENAGCHDPDHDADHLTIDAGCRRDSFYDQMRMTAAFSGGDPHHHVADEIAFRNFFAPHDNY